MEGILNQMFNGVQWQVSDVPANTGGKEKICFTQNRYKINPAIFLCQQLKHDMH